MEWSTVKSLNMKKMVTNIPDQLYQVQNMLFSNKSRVHNMELQVMLGSEKATREARPGLDSLQFYFPLEHELNVTFPWSKC